MTDDERTYFDTMEDLFGHPGWKLLIEESQRMIYQLQADTLDERVCKTWDNVNYTRGRAAQLHELVLLPQIIENARKEHEDASV